MMGQWTSYASECDILTKAQYPHSCDIPAENTELDLGMRNSGKFPNEEYLTKKRQSYYSKLSMS